MPTPTQAYPEAYSQAIDEVLIQESFTTPYRVTDAEFVNNKTVKIPRIEFDGGTVAYDRFATPGVAATEYDTYTLDSDRQKVFYEDAVEAIDDHNIKLVTKVSEFERRYLVPEIDTYFFGKAAAAAKTKATETISKTNIKGELQKIRTQMKQAGIAAANLYMSSAALYALEDAMQREYGNDGIITDEVGKYNMFTLFEVDDTRLGGNDFIAIAQPSTKAIELVWKRAIHKQFSPEVNQNGDGWLDQMRWVYGTVALKNKNAGIYVNKATTQSAG